MSDTQPDLKISLPTWPTCTHHGGETDGRCRGKRSDEFDRCLAHLAPDQLSLVLRRLRPGADLDASGTPISAELLNQILHAVTASDERPTFGAVSFFQAQFSGRPSWIVNAKFNGNVIFAQARFSDDVFFSLADFAGEANFAGVHFGGNAWFDRAQFTGNALFFRAHFNSNIGFRGAVFADEVSFEGAKFQEATLLGPLAARTLSIEWATFSRRLTIEAAAVAVHCREAKWPEGITLRLRYARVDLESVTFPASSAVIGADQPFKIPPGVPAARNPENTARPVNEDHIRNAFVQGSAKWVPVLTSLHGSDIAHLSIVDVNLSLCRFAGTRNLDQLLLEGRCIFDHAPQGIGIGLAWPPILRWTRRQTLAEERAWRATTKYASWWPKQSSEPVQINPDRLVHLYRQLRKAQEDTKNEPGAADFYYGEMEMRRKASATPAAERVILRLYWLISGYGLRAGRSLAAMAILGAIVTTVLVGWGIANTAPRQHLNGTITTGLGDRGRIDATLQGAPIQLPPTRQRWTAQRTRTALKITLDSIVFRSTDQPLSTAGTWTADAARLLGPVLLALSLLAVRNRVKR
jgi:uncharacterized protein YjbI with pentapeptide repeats